MESMVKEERGATSSHVKKSSSQESGYYSSFWVRVAAHIIDQVVINVAIFALLLVLVIIAGGGYFLLRGAIDSGVLEIIGTIGFVIGWYILPIIASFAYYIYMTHRYQATLGKMAVGIKVVRTDEKNLLLGKIILRETIGKIVSSIILMIGYIMAAFTKKKQSLHDIMADSVVVYKDPEKGPNRIAVGLALGIWSTFIGLMITIFIIFGVVAILSESSNSGDYNEYDYEMEFDETPYDDEYDYEMEFDGQWYDDDDASVILDQEDATSSVENTGIDENVEAIDL